MKLAVGVLIMLGMLAAGAAVLLVQTMGDRISGQPKEQTVQILLAQAGLPARTLLTAEHVKVASVPEKGLPAGYYTDPAQAIGKILRLDVTEGQPISGDLVTAKRSVADLLRPGMRAFEVPLPKRDTGGGLLEPGCIIDAHVTFPLRNRELGEALVIAPLLQQLRILGVNGETVVSEQEGPASRRGSSSAVGNVMVALEVTDAQASVLHLSLEKGKLRLLLRNATDHKFSPVQPMILKDGKLTPYGEPLDPRDPAGLVERVRQVVDQPALVFTAEATAPVDPNAPNDPNTVAPLTRPLAPVSQQVIPSKPASSKTNMEIIRGNRREDMEVKKAEQESLQEEGG